MYQKRSCQIGMLSSLLGSKGVICRLFFMLVASQQVDHSNNLRKKIHVKINEGKITPWSWDMYSKLNVGKRHTDGGHL